jgi:hypothetical protein
VAENTRSSRLAVIEEVTEGTLLDPTAGTNFIPLQPGFSFVGEVETLTNDELRGSIGPSPSIQGLEKPVASFTEYLKHSAVEGQAPNYGLVIESCMGSVSSNATERLTAASSTTTLLKLASGGADFDNPTVALGKAVLVKDGTNGYSIRPVDSRSGNDLTLGFALAAAPAAGLGVGKCVSYRQEDSGHPTYSAHLYRANGGALEAIAGCRTESMTMNLSVGELISLDFNLQGTAFYFNPIRITSSNNKLDFTDDDGTFAATIPVGVYKTPKTLADAVASAMNSANSGETHACVFFSTGANAGKFKISSTGTLLSILWNTGANTANTIAAKLGFSAATNSTGTAATTGYTSASVQSYAASLTPAYDSADPMAAKYMEVLIGDQSDYESACVQSMTITVTNSIQDVKCLSAESGVEAKVVQSRTSEINITAQMKKHDSDKFHRFLNNSDVKFLFNFGTKSGGNWVAGKSGCFYAKSAKVSGVQLGDDNGLVTMEYNVVPYVDSSSNPELFLNFL